ncbi:MAG: ribonuclease P protein component [Treponema sp.]|nr:ribonuclease P protein component [Treponema sp.]
MGDSGNLEAGQKEGNLRFRRECRLKKRGEIRAVFKEGRVSACFGAKLFVLKNSVGHNRIAFTFSRKFGNAVERNRCRRVGREAYRHLQRDVKQGFDLALLVYPVGKDTFSDRMEQLRRLFSRADLFVVKAAEERA